MAPPQIARRLAVLALWCAVLLCFALTAEAKKKKKKQTQLQSKEATLGGFMRLFAMRMLFGLASWVGLGEWAGGLFNGALAPPGSDYDYGDYGGDFGGDFDF